MLLLRIRNGDRRKQWREGHKHIWNRCWRRMLKIKWTGRITNDVFQKMKEERLLLKILKTRRHSWIVHTIRHNEFVVNILEGAISGKKVVGRPRLQYLKQVARNTGADSYPAMKRMACNKSRWKAANQSKDWGIRRRRNFAWSPAYKSNILGAKLRSVVHYLTGSAVFS